MNIHYWKLNAYIGLLAPRRRLHSRMTLRLLLHTTFTSKEGKEK